MLSNLIRSAFFTVKTYGLFGGLISWFILTSILPPIFYVIGFVLLAVLTSAVVRDILRLYQAKAHINCERSLDQQLSLGDYNRVKLQLKNAFPIPVKLNIFEHLPYQLQQRNFNLSLTLKAHQRLDVEYNIRPISRGLYAFGDTSLFVRTHLGLIERRIIIPATHHVKVSPSVLHMREMEIKSLNKFSVYQGVKHIRRLGHSYEFEQIKTYVPGDDFRSINWKATSRKQSLMINQYEDERSQPIYFILDKGRNMKMPFGGLSLIDYAVNTTLAIGNVALKKGDKVGLMSFDKEVHEVVKASNRRYQLTAINEKLYNLRQSDVESDFSQLYQGVTKHIRRRSLLFVISNCNTMHSLKRQLPVLKLMNRKHRLVMILFENTDILGFAQRKSSGVDQVYETTIAEEFLYEQKRIAAEMNAAGIHAIVSKPEALSVNTINKYLELKSQGKA